MSSDNPFEVSSGSLGDRSGRDRDVMVAEVSPRTIEMLNQTRPWVQLMGVLLWIGAVLLGLGSVFIVIGSLLAQNPLMIIMSVFYIIGTVVYVILARSLTTYASKINALNASESVRDLEDALEAQKTFWRLIGIITLVFIILYVLFLVLMVSGVVMLQNFRPN